MDRSIGSVHTQHTCTTRSARMWPAFHPGNQHVAGRSMLLLKAIGNYWSEIKANQPNKQTNKQTQLWSVTQFRVPSPPKTNWCPVDLPPLLYRELDRFWFHCSCSRGSSCPSLVPERWKPSPRGTRQTRYFRSAPSCNTHLLARNRQV